MERKKQMSFLFTVFCGECKQPSSVSRMGRPCPKCGAGPDYVVRASSWNFDNPKVQPWRPGKAKAS